MLRDGQTAILPAEEITVGDVVLLEAGDQIPADGRLIDCASLQTNESALTGESTNVEKFLDTITDEVPLADRKNMVYSGGFVTYGRGAYVVTEVGMQTEVGKIASLIQNAEARKTPLQITLDQFGKRLSIGIMIVCALVFVLSMIRVDVINFSAVMDSLMFAIALAVAAIPEALSFHCHNRAVVWYPEDVAGTRHLCESYRQSRDWVLFPSFVRIKPVP